MTVSTQLCSVTRLFSGQSEINTGFPVDQPEHLVVYEIGVDGREQRLSPGLHYAPSQDETSRLGLVLPLPAMANPTTLRIERETPALQEIDLDNARTYDPRALERELDRTAMRDAELRYGLLPPQATRGGKVLAFDETGRPIAIPPREAGAGVASSEILDSTAAGRARLTAASADAQRLLLSSPRIATGIDALQMLTGTYAAVILLIDDERSGTFRWASGDQTSKLLGPAIASSAVAGDTITSAGHGLKTGFSAIVTTAVNGLAVNTLYRVIRLTDDTFKLATSWANAKAGTAVTLTGAAAVTVKQHYDPLQAKYVAPDITGAGGAWVRHGTVTPYHAGAAGDGVADDTEALQCLLSVGRGQTVDVADGIYKITLELWTVAARTHVCLSHDAEIVHDTPTYNALRVAHTRCRVSGGMGGGWTGPAVWDPATGGVVPSYGVIWTTAEDCTVDKIRMTNVRRIGVGFKDCNRWTIIDPDIDCGCPKPTFPITTTVHFAIFGDPSNAAGLGRMMLSGARITNFINGVSVANYGGGPSNLRSFVATGNSFENGWDHAFYTNYSGGAVITGTTCHRVHQPIACSGPNNIVKGITIYTEEVAAPDERDSAAGISFRDAVNCIASDVSIRGHGSTITGQYPIGVDFINVNGTPMNGNLVDGVRMEVLTGQARAVRIFGDTAHFGNAIKSIYYNGEIVDGEAAVQVVSAPGSMVTIDGVNVVAKGGNGCFAVQARLSNSKISDIKLSIDYNGTAVSYRYIGAVMLANCSDTMVDDVIISIAPTKGQHFRVNDTPSSPPAIIGVEETTGAARNRVTNVHQVVALPATSFEVPVKPLASPVDSDKMWVSLISTNAPSWPAAPGSVHHRPVAGALYKFFVNEGYAVTAGDGLKWVGK